MEQTYQGMLDEFAGRAMQALLHRGGAPEEHHGECLDRHGARRTTTRWR